MKIAYFRSSSYNNWELCQMQWFLTYGLGLYNPSGKAAEKGTIFHKTMEVLANCKLGVQNETTSFEDDSIGMVKVDPSLMMDDRFVGSIFERSWDYYTDPEKSVNKFTQRDKDEIVTLLHKVLGTRFDPRVRDVVAVEPHFDFEIDEPWAHYEWEDDKGNLVQGKLAIKGTVDLVTQIGPNAYEVIDWKTGRRINWGTGEEKTWEKLNYDPQLCIYHWALNQLYGPKSFLMTLHYVKDGGPFTMSYGKDKLDYTMKIVRRRFEAIKRTSIPLLKHPTSSHWFCTKVCYYGKTNWPGTDCSTCQYVKHHLEQQGLEATETALTASGFKLNYYSSPGA